jgi:hypothetical protein
MLTVAIEKSVKCQSMRQWKKGFWIVSERVQEISLAEIRERTQVTSLYQLVIMRPPREMNSLPSLNIPTAIRRRRSPNGSGLLEPIRVIARPNNPLPIHAQLVRSPHRRQTVYIDGRHRVDVNNLALAGGGCYACLGVVLEEAV